MPTNLGVLATDKPFLNGKVQIRRGAADLGRNYTSANAGQAITDSNGAQMAITYTPTYPCYWVVKTNVMAHGLNDGAGWRRWDHSIGLSPADVNGDSTGFQSPGSIYDYTGGPEWRTFSCSAMFRLAAGTAYTSYLVFTYVSAGTAIVHVGSMWCRIVGRIVAEGYL